MRRIPTLIILLVLASCASAPPHTGRAAPSASQSTSADIVGTWRGQNTCEGIIDAMQAVIP